MNLFKKNNIYFGILLAVAAPAVAFGILYLLDLGLVAFLNNGKEVMQQDTLVLTSIFLNLFIFLPYIRNEKYERTGRGVMLVTFIGVVVYFLFQI
jgi:hypothetical protein